MRWKYVAIAVVAVAAIALVPQLRPREAVESKADVDRVVLVTIDALRQDRLGCYGYTRRPTTPNLDAWAPYAAIFDEAFSPAPWTIPALGALFTVVNRKGGEADRASFDRAMFALGLDLKAAEAPKAAAPAEVTALAEKRWAAKAAKDFKAADALRAEIAATGWTMLDRKDGYSLEPLKK